MIATRTDELFDPGLLAQFESLSLLARQLVRSNRRAERRSLQRGASVEFAEYRPFVHGDDWRHIDWNAYARWRQLVLKLFVEEEDLHVHLLLDCSQSMDWGNPIKFDYARQLIAGLAYITLANMDRAAVVPLGVSGHATWQPSRGRQRFLQMLDYLAACPIARQHTTLEDTVRRWVASQPRRGMVILVSDLFGADIQDAFRALDRLRYARQEVAVVQVFDPGELDAGTFGEFEVEDCETAQTQKVIIDSRLARAFQTRAVEYQEKVSRYCRAHRIPLLQESTALDVPGLISRSLLGGGFVK